MAKDKETTPSWAKRKPLSKAETIEKLQDMERAAYSMARATTGDADVRAGYMDRCHLLREALRHLGS